MLLDLNRSAPCPQTAKAPELELCAAGWRRGGRTVLERLSFGVPFGTRLAVVGPNGAGKSTLLRLLAGRLAPSAGQVLLGGQDLSTLPSAQRALQMAVVHQHEPVHGQLTVRDYVTLGRIPHRHVDAAASEAVVGEVLRLCRLTALQDRFMGALSGGEQQRAAIGRAMAQQPRILLLDEPTNHLDLRTRADMLDLLADADITVVAALHELSLVQRFADRVLLLSGGHLVADGRPEDVLTQALVSAHFGMDVFYLSLPQRAQDVAVFDSPQSVVPLARRTAAQL